MSPSPHMVHIVKLSAIIACLIFTAFYILLPADPGHGSFFNVAVSGKKGTFIETASTAEIDGPFDNSTLVELCKSRTWSPGLIFECEPPAGGIANVRNTFLNCVRFAIEAGATGFVIPEILARGTSPSTLHTNVPVPFTHYFDLEHFTTSLSTSCPQIHIYSHVNDLWDKPSTATPIILVPSSLSPTIANTVIAQPANWTTNFQYFLNRTYTRQFTPSFPVLVSLNRPLLQFPLSYDSPAFIANFGKILRFNLSLRRLASAVLYSLSQSHALNLSPASPIQKGKFYGAHLRTGPDAQAAGWTPYSIQAVNYLSSASRMNLSTIYVVSGNAEDISQFSATAATHSISVETKESLLGGPLPLPTVNDAGITVQGQRMGAKGFESEWHEFSKLTSDQKGVVDYEVLLWSSAFGGTWESSFGWGVAMKRHVVASAGGWKPLDIQGKGAEGQRGAITKEDLEKARARIKAERIKGKKGKFRGAVSGIQTMVGELCFVDGLSVVFGPKGEGAEFKLALWP